MNARHYCALVGALVATLTSLLGPGLAAAERIEPTDELLRRGDATYLSNCITGSRYYFAYLQRADNVDPARSRLLDQRISDCEEGFSGGAGNDAKYDRLDTPKSRNCHAYTQLAIAQHRVNVGARCRFEGSRWSSDYQHHFGWCSSAGVGSGDLRHENDERRKALDGCVFK